MYALLAYKANTGGPLALPMSELLGVLLPLAVVQVTCPPLEYYIISTHTHKHTHTT